MKKIELRSSKLSLISDENSNDLIVSGYVNLIDDKSQVLGSDQKFIEKIQRGAFQRAVNNKKRDIDFLAEHDARMILASTRNNSLTLKEDSKGLYMEARIAATSYGKDYFTLIKDGVLRNMSFGFKTIKDTWIKLSNGLHERSVQELELFEVSVVRNPAYLGSNIAARNIELIEDKLYLQQK